MTRTRKAPTCQHPGCRGYRVTGHDLCRAHLPDELHPKIGNRRQEEKKLTHATYRWHYARLAAGFWHVITRLDGRTTLVREAQAMYHAATKDLEAAEGELPLERRSSHLVFSALHGLPPFEEN